MWTSNMDSHHAIYELILHQGSSPSEREVGWECLAGFYVPVSALLLVNVFFYWTAQRTMARQMLYNRYILHNGPILLGPK